jgi:type I restriction enzyme R subunit
MQAQLRRRRLPHLDIPGATYFVTACLHGSIPALGLANLQRRQEELLASHPREMTLKEWERKVWKMMFVEREKWLDGEPSARHLEHDSTATIVRNALKFFAGIRYELVSHVIMPSHFHWVFRPLKEYEASLPADQSPRATIMHSVKSYTANERNKVLGRLERFWQDESYDHCVADEAELERIVEYIEFNPCKAGLCVRPEQWKYSSAYQRLPR